MDSDDAIARLPAGADVVAKTPKEIKKERRMKILTETLRYIKMTFLLICWLLFTSSLMIFEEHKPDVQMLTVPTQGEAKFILPEKYAGANVVLCLRGTFAQLSFKYEDQYYSEDKHKHKTLLVTLQEVDSDNNVRNVTRPWSVYIAEDVNLAKAQIIDVERIFNMNDEGSRNSSYQFLFHSNIKLPLPIEMSLDLCNVSISSGILIGTILLSFIYIFLIFDLLHRAFAGVICCTLGLGILAAVHMRQDLMSIMHWIPMDTLMNYFGMSIVMSILAETGFNDYLAATGYQLSNGHIWPLLNVLLFIGWLMPMFFNNITIALFMTPICLRLCEIMALNHVPVLTCLMVSINMGSSYTVAPGSTNNAIINHKSLGNNPVSIGMFLFHMSIPVLLATAQAYLHLRLLYINSERMRVVSTESHKLQHQIRMWRKAATSVKVTTLEERNLYETINQRIKTLNARLQRMGKMPEPPPNYEQTLKNISHYFTLHNLLFLVAGLTALMVICIFTLLSFFPKLTYLSPGWIAIVAALLALTIVDLEHLDMVLGRVDWGNMIFISAQFILVKILMMLGLLEAIGVHINKTLFFVDEKYALLVGILVIIWISALLSTIMDNMPVADMMIRIIVRLTRNQQHYVLPRDPLIWAMSLGCTLGANSSLVASFGNLTISGVANMHGYHVSFITFLIIAFPVMAGTVLVVTIYMLIVYVWIGWG